MRRSPEINVLEEDGKVFGLVLGGDYTAEHEMGIDALQKKFGCTIQVDASACGIDARTMTTPFAGFAAEWRRETHAVTEKRLYRDSVIRKPLRQRETAVDFIGACRDFSVPSTEKPRHATALLSFTGPRFLEIQDFTAAWSSQSFLVAGWTKKARLICAFIDEGIRAGDIAIWLGGAGGNPFARSGLVLARPSAVPDFHKETMLKADLDRLELDAMAEATGIKAKIDAQNGASRYFRLPSHGYYALTPRRANAAEQDRTRHPVLFFLNPFHARAANSGWYTVEELELWLEDSGPIVRGFGEPTGTAHPSVGRS